MPDVKGFQLLSPEVQSSLTSANKQFLASVQQAAASIREGETKKLNGKNHKASIKKQSGSGIVSVDVTPSGSAKGQKLSVAARFYKERDTALDFSTRITVEGESIAALDTDGDGNHDIGSFLYDYSIAYAGYQKHLGRDAIIQDKNDNGKVDQVDLLTEKHLDALIGAKVIIDNKRTGQTIYDTDDDGLLDRFGGMYEYDSRGNSRLVKSEQEIEQNRQNKEMTPVEVLRSTTLLPEADYSSTGTPSRELMQAFIRNGGPISWDKK